MSKPVELTLRIPQPPGRRGDVPDFSYLSLQDAGVARRPHVESAERDMRDMPYGLIRVLDADGQAVGPWDPSLDADQLRQGLKAMMLARCFDTVLVPRQRVHAGNHGTKPFFITSTGEEAIGAAPSMVLRRDDMCFPTYRVVSYLMARQYPLIELVNQLFSNASDRLKGRQLPILYSAREYGFCSLSGNVGSRIGHAVGWAMASAYKRDSRIALAYVGEGAAAEGDSHEAMTFAAVYRAPVILAIVNNQWALSTFQSIAGGENTTFAARAIGYGLPGLRVDGNDFLAVWAATEWAAERARSNHGATVIEFVTYRAGAHSTSDDPRDYRPDNEAAAWPLGDPIDRLKRHLIRIGAWSEQQHTTVTEELQGAVSDAVDQGEAIEPKPNVCEMFKDVFKEQDWRLIEQQRELGV